MEEPLAQTLEELLTLGGIAMAIGAFVGLVGFSRSFEHEWLRMYLSSGTDIAVVQQTFLNTSVSESAGATLKALPIVAQATPMILNLMDLTPEVNALAYGWKADSYEFDSLTLKSGRRFRDGQPEVMLGDLLAENMKKKPGDTLEIQGSTFTVAGIYHGGSALEAGAVIAAGPDAEAGQPGGQGDGLSCAAQAGAVGRSARALPGACSGGN
jgi:putative ABC transport system permease protein